jgi:hypothetical protein
VIVITKERGVSGKYVGYFRMAHVVQDVYGCHIVAVGHTIAGTGVVGKVLVIKNWA